MKQEFGKKLVGLCVTLMLCLPAAAADWPQWLGPSRDGISTETGLLKTWPEGGPPLLWQCNGIGAGYSSASVSGGTIYATGILDDGFGYLFAISLDGSVKWQQRYGKEPDGGGYHGSRTTPTIDEGRVFLMSGAGEVVACDAASGKQLWKVDTVAKFGAKQLRWDITESLLVDGPRLICTPGGKEAAVVALDKKTGATVWTSNAPDDASGYCSPILLEREGRRVLVTMTARWAIGLDADQGKLLWQHPFPNKYGVNAVTPVVEGNLLFITASSSYDSQGVMLELSPDGSSVTQLWQNPQVGSKHHGVILKDGYLYAVGDGRHRKLHCLEARSGKLLWQSPSLGRATTMYADGMLYIYSEKGSLTLAEASSSGYKASGQLEVTAGSGEHWAYPIIANGRLYVRHGEVLLAYRISRDDR
jgi:outer membrane protein assembly factor BamB